MIYTLTVIDKHDFNSYVGCLTGDRVTNHYELWKRQWLGGIFDIEIIHLNEDFFDQEDDLVYYEAMVYSMICDGILDPTDLYAIGDLL